MDDGRFVARYSPEELSASIEQAHFESVNIWITPDSLPGRNSIDWVNAIARKPSDG